MSCFFFQAEDGIRDLTVTGVQTCALPIYLDAAIAGYAEYVAHVQIADAPGRGEPGSGQLDLDRYLAALAGRGYRGWVSLEYKPTGTTEASLAWLPRERRAAPAGGITGKEQS